MAWNRSSEDGSARTPVAPRRTRSVRPTGVRGLIAGAIVVLGAAIAAWWLWPEGERAGETPAPRDAGLIKEVTPAPAPKAKSVEPEPVKPPLKIVQKKQYPPGTPLVTNSLGHVRKKGPFFTPEEAAAFERLKRDSTIRTIAEKRMEMLANVPMGCPIPPLPGSDAQFDKSWPEASRNIIELLSDDTEQDLKRKEFVIALKDRLQEEIDGGKTPSQAFNDYVALVNDVAKYSRETMQAARELVAQGNREEADRLIADVNKELEELGAKPLSLDRKPKRRKQQ